LRPETNFTSREREILCCIAHLRYIPQLELNIRDNIAILADSWNLIGKANKFQEMKYCVGGGEGGKREVPQ